jgi:hypothetical protein
MLMLNLPGCCGCERFLDPDADGLDEKRPVVFDDKRVVEEVNDTRRRS